MPRPLCCAQQAAVDTEVAFARRIVERAQQQPCDLFAFRQEREQVVVTRRRIRLVERLRRQRRHFRRFQHRRRDDRLAPLAPSIARANKIEAPFRPAPSAVVVGAFANAGPRAGSASVTSASHRRNTRRKFVCDGSFAARRASSAPIALPARNSKRASCCCAWYG